MSYNKRLQICLRSRKTITRAALEVEAVSMPLRIRRKFLAQREILQTYSKNSPMKRRLEEMKGYLDGHRLTYLQDCCRGMALIIGVTYESSHRYTDTGGRGDQQERTQCETMETLGELDDQI